MDTSSESPKQATEFGVVGSKHTFVEDHNRELSRTDTPHRKNGDQDTAQDNNRTARQDLRALLLFI